MPGKDIGVYAAEALHAYAQELPKALNQLSESNNKLITTARRLEEGLGFNSDEILAVIQSIQHFVEESAEPIENMQQIMDAKADEIFQLHGIFRSGGN